MTITAGAAQSTRTGMYASSYRLPSLNKRKSTATCSRFFQPRAPRGMMLWKAGNKPRPIYRLLQNMPMGPEEIDRLTTAYEQALRTLGIVDRSDPLAELIARKIIEIAQTGVRAERHFCCSGSPGNRYPQQLEHAKSQLRGKAASAAQLRKKGSQRRRRPFRGVASHGGKCDIISIHHSVSRS